MNYVFSYNLDSYQSSSSDYDADNIAEALSPVFRFTKVRHVSTFAKIHLVHPEKIHKDFLSLSSLEQKNAILRKIKSMGEKAELYFSGLAIAEQGGVIVSI